MVNLVFYLKKRFTDSDGVRAGGSDKYLSSHRKFLGKGFPVFIQGTPINVDLAKGCIEAIVRINVPTIPHLGGPADARIAIRPNPNRGMRLLHWLGTD